MQMKHVETAAFEGMRIGVDAGRGRSRLLVTGFGPFPGAPSNPSAAILRRLARHAPRLARLGITLETRLLPVVYTAIEPVLRAEAEAIEPNAILHLGLAGRRKRISVETRAINRAGPLHPDAARKRTMQQIAPGQPQILTSTFSAHRLVAAIEEAGVPVHRSIDAGDYVCNYTLYTSLAHRFAPIAGFIHVPRPRRLTRPLGRPNAVDRPSLDDLTRGVLAAIMALAPALSRSRRL